MDKLHLISDKDYKNKLLSLELDNYELEDQIYKFLVDNNKQLPWYDREFDSFKELIDDENEYIRNPIKIEYNSLIKCQKCNLNKVHTYSKQVRSCDEGCTVFCVCLSCNSSWTL